MKTTLVIMAAGIGSRFGGEIKQLAPVGMNGEIIMDYSIHDAIEAGFNKIVFIIRKDMEVIFKKVIGNRIEDICNQLDVEVAYAFQEMENVPKGVTFPKGRNKPWGTGHAILACKGVINEPFIVINADDYYGKEAFHKIYDFLREYDEEHKNEFCMAGFVLKNTLSDNGGVTRGICRMDENNYLTDIIETYNIKKTYTNGKYIATTDTDFIDLETLVSMNMWGLTPKIIDLLDKGFEEFFEGIEGDSEKEMKAEYILPMYIDKLLKQDKVTVKVLNTDDKWFGITYKEDKDIVIDSFKELIEAGVYEKKLFSNLLRMEKAK